MEKAPATRIAKPALYKMVSYKGTTGGTYKGFSASKEVGLMKKDFSKGFTSVISGINSLGTSLNSIALGMSEATSALKTSVSKQIQNANKVVQIQEKALEEDKDREKRKIADEARRRKLQQRDDAEDKSEEGEPSLMKKISNQFEEGTKKSFGGLFSGLLRFSGFLFKAMIGFAALKWIAKNPDSVQRLAETMARFGKFIFNVSSFLAGSALEGLIKFLENPISLKGLFGSLQFIASLAPLLVSLAFLKNPVGTVRGVAWLISTLGKSISGIMKGMKGMDKMRVFARNKFAKLGLGLGTGVVAFTASMASGADAVEAVGAGVGATGGAMIGQTVGNAIAGPVGGALLGAAGGFLGGKAGASVGKMLKPLTEPIGRFFSMVGESFNAIVKPIGDAMGGLFQALGDIMNGVLDFIQPHMPLITKILQIGITTLFGPLFLGMKALTAVLKFFAPKGKETKTMSASESMSYKRAYNPETGLREVIDGTQGEGVDINEANRHNYTRQMLKLERKKNEDKIRAEARGDKFDPSKYDEQLLKLEKAYNSTLEFGSGMQTSASRAKGGWINGPMSGYPVSLDGGRSTAFIGHGLEWVGSKMASGGAFVVPFDTPATKKDSNLTSKRFREAMDGGYQLPALFEGGRVDPDQLVGGYTDITTKTDADGNVTKSKDKVLYAIDINHLYKHRRQIERQLPDGATVEDIINSKPINIDSRKLDRILASSDAQKATKLRMRAENLKNLPKTLKNMTALEGFKTQREVMSSVFNKISGVKENIGDFINDAKLAFIDMKNERRNERNKVITAPPTTAPPIMSGGGGGSGQVVPIVSKEDREADPYLISRFGLVSEFNGDPADLM